MINNKTLTKLTLLLASMMTMMAGAVVAPSLPQINNIFSQTPNADILTRLIITLPPLFIALFSPILGKISDTFGRKKILLFSVILYAISGTSAYFLNNLHFILVSRAFLGITVAGIMTMAIALIGDYYTGNERSKFLGIQGAFMGIGGVIFISFAGWLADFGWQVPFLIYLFGFIILPLVIIHIYEPEINKKSKASTKPTTNNTNYSKTLVNIIFTIVFFSIIVFYMIPVQIPYVLKQIPDTTNTQIGLAIASQSLAGSIVAMNYRKIKSRLSFCSLYQIAFLCMAIGYFIISISNVYSVIILGLVVSGLGVGLLMPTGNMWIIEVAPENIRGKLVGKANTAVFIAMFCSPIVVQPIIKLTSISGAFFVMAIAQVVFIALLTVLKKNKQIIGTSTNC